MWDPRLPCCEGRYVMWQLCEAAGTQKQLQGGAGWHPAMEKSGASPPTFASLGAAPQAPSFACLHCQRPAAIPVWWRVTEWLTGNVRQGEPVKKLLLPGKSRRLGFKVWCWRLCFARVQPSRPDTAILLHPKAGWVQWSDGLPEDGAQGTMDQAIVQSIIQSSAFSATFRLKMDQASVSLLASLPHELAAASQMWFSKKVYQGGIQYS